MIEIQLCLLDTLQMHNILNHLILLLCIHLTNDNIIQAYSTVYITKELIVHRYIHQHTYGATYNLTETLQQHTVSTYHGYIRTLKDSRCSE